MKYAWIEKHRQLYATTMMCDLLSVSRSGLNAARGRAPSKRAGENKQVLEQIRRGHRVHRGRYGRRRMTPEGKPGAGPGGQPQARCPPDARARAAKPQAPAISGGNHGLQTRAPGGAQRAGARLPCECAQPEVAGRHDLRCNGRRVVVRGLGAGPARTQIGGLGDELGRCPKS